MAGRCARHRRGARGEPIGKFDLRAALNLNEEGLDGVANPDDRVAALGLDRGPIIVGDKGAVAEAPRAADPLGKPGGRGVGTQSHEIGRPGQQRPAKLFGFDFEAGTQGS